MDERFIIELLEKNGYLLESTEDKGMYITKTYVKEIKGYSIYAFVNVSFGVSSIKLSCAISDEKHLQNSNTDACYFAEEYLQDFERRVLIMTLTDKLNNAHVGHLV